MVTFAAQLARSCYPILFVFCWVALGFLVASLISLLRPGSLNQRQVRSWQHACNWCAGLAPMVGLLGTISGVRDGLGSMTSGSASDLTVMGTSLSYSFGTTLVGLIAAAIAISAHSLLSLYSEGMSWNGTTQA